MPYCFCLQKKVNCDQTLTAINFNKGITGKEKIEVYLDKLDVFKLWKPDEIHPRILAGLPQKTPESVVIIRGEVGWGGEHGERRRMANTAPLPQTHAENYRAGSLN